MGDVSDDALAEATGRTRAEWFKLLDKWGAAERAHREIAEHLAQERGLDAWWAQTVTVEYERARGLRAVGQRADGLYEASVQRTLAAPADVVERALREWGAQLDAALAAEPRATSPRAGRVLRYASERSRVEITLARTPQDGTRVRVVEGNLARAEDRDAAKRRWIAVLEDLRGRLGEG